MQPLAHARRHRRRGAVLGIVATFIHAPLTAGVLSALYRRERAERARIGAAEPPPRYLVDARRGAAAGRRRSCRSSAAPAALSPRRASR